MTAVASSPVLVAEPASVGDDPSWRDRGGPVRRGFGRRKFDKQPTEPAAVVIATNGVSIPGAALRLALRMSQGEPVAVVSLARIYGSAYGLPNPGLMPTRREMAEQKEIVDKALAALAKAGVAASGQIAATRKPVKTIASVARARQARHVIVVRPEQAARWRQLVEGDLAKDVARKLGSEYEVESVSP
jgi:hypothetical protein